MAAGGTFLFALKSIFIKLAYRYDVDAILVLTLRMGLAFPFYIAVLIWDRVHLASGRRETPSGVIPRPWHAMALGFFGYYLASYLDLAGLAYLTAQLERLTLFTYPTMIALLAWLFLGERIDLRMIVAIFLSYLGIAVMYIQEAQLTGSHETTWGMLLVLGSALSYSIYVVASKRQMQFVGSRWFTSWAMIGSATFVMFHFLATNSPSILFSVPLPVWGYGCLLAFVCTVIPSYLISESLVRLGAARTTVIGSAGPVLTMGLSILLLDEPTTLCHFVGMALVLLGVALAARR